MALVPIVVASLLCASRTVQSSIVLPDFAPRALAPVFHVWKGDKVPIDLGRFLDEYVKPKCEAPGGCETPPAPTDAVGLQFPLQGTKVESTVANGIAYVRVTQMYRNDGNDCLQSRYIFPLPEKAAITAMSMRLGGRTIVGKIRTRDTAREEFLKAQASGQQASLLEQQRPNVFSMDLSNILPNQTTETVVEYSETLSPIDGVYAFTFPTVVGPRYGSSAWSDGRGTSDVNVTINITVSPACRGLDSFLPMTLNNFSNSTQATMQGSGQDIVIKFWFTEAEVDARLLVSQQGSGKYFSIGIQPPQRRLLASEQISSREYLFILDTSGSMTGYPLDLSRKLMRNLLINNVRIGDSLNILLFAGGSKVYSPDASALVTQSVIADADAWLNNNMNAGGGTELLPALKHAFSLPRSRAAASRTVIIMTDGYVNVEKEAFDLVRTKLGEGNVFAFGIGTSVNRYLIEGLARVGYGEPFIVMNPADGDAVAAQLERYIDSPVLTGVSLEFPDTFKAFDQEPPYLPDVFASRPVQVVGRFSGELSGQVSVKGYLADGTRWSYSADLAQIRLVNTSVVSILWARARIATIGDYAALSDSASGASAVAEITALGLNYSLMTQYTSFVAVDSDPQGPAMCRGNLQNNSGLENPTQAQDLANSFTAASTSMTSSSAEQLRGVVVVLVVAVPIFAAGAA